MAAPRCYSRLPLTVYPTVRWTATAHTMRMEDRWSWLIWLLAAVAVAAFVRLEGLHYVPSAEGLYWLFILGAGLAAGIIAPARWSVTWMFGGIALFLFGCAIVWAWSQRLSFVEIVNAPAGPAMQFTAGACMSLIAGGITIMRRLVGTQWF